MRRAVVLAALLLAASPVAAETVVVTADRMLDVTTGRMVDRPAITVTDGRIVAIARQGSAPLPAGARAIDLAGFTLVPGLIDMHVHLTSEPTIGGYRRLEYTDAFWTTLGVVNARRTLEAGFTTVRNVGSKDYADVALKQGVDGGFYPGPRIVPATYAIGATGGHCDDNLLPPSYEARGAAVSDGKDEIRRTVRRLHKYGAEVIKLCATGGVFSRRTEPGAQQLTEDEMEVAVEEARMLGLRVAAHAHGTAGVKAAIEAGVTTVEHASFLDDEAIAMAKKAGTWLSMDIYNTEYTLAEGEKNGVLPESLEKERRVGTIQRDSFRRAVAAGVKMVFGTDAGIYPHGDNARQFARMVRFGMTPLQAIQAATVNAARALGREGDVGAIAVGRLGDMVAVAGDPTADVTLLERPAAVIKGGAVAFRR